MFRSLRIWCTPKWSWTGRNSRRNRQVKQIDDSPDLVGNSTILDRPSDIASGWTRCLRWLGGLAPIADFNPLLQMPSGVI